MKYSRISFLFALAGVLLAGAMMNPPAVYGQDTGASAAEAEQESRVGDVNVNADSYEFEAGTRWATASGNVRISYRGIIIEADTVRLNAETKDVEATGNVYFYTLESVESQKLKQRFFWTGEELTGNLEEPRFQSGEHQVLAGAWYETGEKAEYRSDKRVVFHNVSLSTCEYIHSGHEHYSINAKKVVYTPEGKIIAYHTWYKVGKVPIFYWPFVYWDDDPEDSGGAIHWRLGYDDDWGGYVLASRSWQLTDTIDTKVQVDWRSKRGFALGNRTRRVTENSISEFMVYGMKDNEAPETSPGFNRRFDSEDDRYRLNASHQQFFGDHWELRLNVDAMSDVDFLEEWFEDEFDQYRQPRSFLDLRYNHERFTAAMHVRPRVNDFYSVVERLPEFRVDFPRQTIPAIPGLLYEGETSLANLKMDWREFDVPRPPGFQYPADYDAWRFDTLHMFYLPMLLGGDKFRLVPRAGVRLTYYDETSNAAITSADLINMFAVDDPDRLTSVIPVNNYDDNGGSALRFTGEVGVELSTKFYRVWDDVKNEFWQIDGLRHVIQPFLNYTYIMDPTEDREHLYFFDMVDRITEQNFVRVGVDQRLQTRHPDRDEIYTLAELRTYADFHFEAPQNGENLGDLGIVFIGRPRPTFRVTGTIIADMGEGNLNRAELGFGFGEPGKLRVDVSYLYRDDYQTDFLQSMGSTLSDYTGENIAALRFSKNHYATFTAQFPLGPKMEGYIRYEYDLDEGDLARQVYQLTRDLHCWVGGLRFEEEDGQNQIQLVLYLKAFPSIGSNPGTHQTGL